MKRFLSRWVKVFLLALFCSVNTYAAVTRSQLLKMFYQATVYNSSGKTDQALETYQQIVTLVPQLPDTYLRMAEVYDKDGQTEAAIVMYRKFISLEMDDKKTAEPSARLKELENKVGIAHYEEEDQKEAFKLFSKIDDSSKEKAPDSTPSAAITATPSVAVSTTPSVAVSTTTSVAVSTTTSAAAPNVRPESSEVPASTLSTPAGVFSSEGLTSEEIDTTWMVEADNDFDLSNEGFVSRLFDLTSFDGLSDSSAVVDTAEIFYVVDLSDNKVDRESIESLSQGVGAKETKLVVEQIDASFIQEVKSEVTADTKLTDCDAILSVYPARDRLNAYRIKSAERYDNVPKKAESTTLESILAGHWVSSLSGKNGGETWIFSFSKVGENWRVNLDDASDVFSEPQKGIMDVSWNKVKSIWSEEFSFEESVQNLPNKTVYSSIDKEKDKLSYSFSYEKSHETRTSTYSWSKEILAGVSVLVPFGSVFNKAGSIAIDYIKSNDVSKNYVTTLEFNIEAVTEDVLKCQCLIVNKMTTSDGKNHEQQEEQQFYLFKTPSIYSKFEILDQDRSEVFEKKLYSIVKDDASKDINKSFPLAFMTYYGIGIQPSVSKSIEIMNKLAVSGDCDKAKCWLIPMYYNLSLDEENFSSKTVRKKFRTEADAMLNELIKEEEPYAFCIKADAVTSLGSEVEDVMKWYQLASDMGEVYGTYSLGVQYFEGQNVTKDYDKAKDYFEKAADMGYPDAYYQLALMSKSGLGMERDYDKYIRYLMKAIDIGSLPAIKELYEAYMLGLGVNRDFMEAIRIKQLYHKALNEEWKEVLAIYGYNASI